MRARHRTPCMHERTCGMTMKTFKTPIFRPCEARAIKGRGHAQRTHTDKHTDTHTHAHTHTHKYTRACSQHAAHLVLRVWKDETNCMHSHHRQVTPAHQHTHGGSALRAHSTARYAPSVNGMMFVAASPMPDSATDANAPSMLACGVGVTEDHEKKAPKKHAHVAMRQPK
jgi:hypothetical protein